MNTKPRNNDWSESDDEWDIDDRIKSKKKIPKVMKPAKKAKATNEEVRKAFEPERELINCLIEGC